MITSEEHEKYLNRMDDIFNAVEGTPEFLEMGLILPLIIEYEKVAYPMLYDRETGEEL